MPETTRLWTWPFLLLCLSQVLFAASFTMIIPELPAYLSSLGGAEYKGLIISLFTVTAGASRPFSGKLTDTIGRIPVMVFGTLVCVVCSLLYPFATTVFGFLALRFFHGFSTGFKPTASTAYAADIVPDSRRGEALGIMGISMNTGASIAPPVGSWLALTWSLDVMFIASSVMALLSVLMLLGLQETLEEKQPFRPAHLAVKKEEILDLRSIPPAILTIVIYLGFGALLTIVPDQSDHLGLANKGLFFTSYTVCSLLPRFLAGKVSDRWGRIPVLLVSLMLLGLSLAFMALVNSPALLLVASGCMGFSLGTAAPTVFAWAIDRSPRQRWGRAMATVYLALEIGIGLGAFCSALIYANDPANFGRTFFITAVFAFAGMGYLWVGSRFSRFGIQEKVLGNG